MGVYYMDGEFTHASPRYKDLGYTFLPAQKFKILSLKLGTTNPSIKSFKWLPIDSFGLDKIPVKVQGVYQSSRTKGDKLIAYKYYLTNKDGYPVSSLYYFREAKIESQLDFPHNYSAPILVFDNSLPKIKEMFRSRIEPKGLRENIEIISKSQIEDFEDDYIKELNNLYEQYNEMHQKLVFLSNGELKENNEFLPEGNAIIKKESERKVQITEKHITEKTPNKILIRDYELEDGNYQVCTCYIGENIYKDILVKSDIETDENLLTSCKISFTDLNEDDLTMTKIKTYKRRFKNIDDYVHNYDIFLLETEMKFVEEYNVTKMKSLNKLLEEEYGKQDIYTVEQVKYILHTNNMEQSSKEKLKKLTINRNI